MNCPFRAGDYTELIEYSVVVRRTEENTATGKHARDCADCRRFIEGQRAVWAALDSWEGPMVSADFDDRLYKRIENSRPWWDALLRPLATHRGLTAAAAACLLITVGIMIERAPAPPAPVKTDSAVVDVQPEQLEKALDTMEMLSEFTRKARAEGTASKL